MADVLTEPRVKRLAPALGNIFNQMYARLAYDDKQLMDFLKIKIENMITPPISWLYKTGSAINPIFILKQ